MDENEASLDVEFKRYLQIMRPYLGQLLDQDVIDICKAWIQRLSNCGEKEKLLRNRYVFGLCYQLAKGILEEPFLRLPSDKELEPLPEDLDSNSSNSEIEYNVTNFEEGADILNCMKEIQISETDYLSQENDLQTQSKNHNDIHNDICGTQKLCDFNQESNSKSLYFHSFLQAAKVNDEYRPYDEYKGRANNLVMKLREIKTQNILLKNELETLRNEYEPIGENEEITKVDNVGSEIVSTHEDSATILKMKNTIQELKGSKISLIQTINKLQEKLGRFEEIKKREIEEIEASFKIEILKIKGTTRNEIKEVYEQKLEELKTHYESMLKSVESKLVSERQSSSSSKEEIINQKDTIIKAKDIEIEQLKIRLEDQKNQLNDVIKKFLDKPNENISHENMKIKAEQLEKRLNKMEKSKTKFAQMYEAKLAHLQREKHLAECSLQLQLVRQRAQVVNEVADESQSELNAALNKLENKYKGIVANVQATALQRRVQDQMALESILHAACGIRNGGFANCSQGSNRSQISSKTMQNQNRNGNLSYDSELSALLQGNKVENVIVGNKSLGEDSVAAGYCLDGERMGELFERVCIPQRDIGDGPSKK